MLHFWNRVYINIGKDFSMNLTGLDFEMLIDEVAIHKRVYNGVPLLEETEKDGRIVIHVFRGRTKRFIVQKTNAFICGIKEVQSAEENMASFTSKRQLNRLIDAFHGKNKRISAYALVIIYVMFAIILENPCKSAFDCTPVMKDIIHCIIGWVKAYSAEYSDDELATFLLDCLKTVSDALDRGDSGVSAEEFPYIPKQNPDDSLDD